MDLQKRFPIKVAAQKSGLSAHVIRAWEKRYGVINPSRSDTNRRLYSEEDIYLLSLLRQATQEGHSISSIADLKIDALEQLLLPEVTGIKRDYSINSDEHTVVNDHFQKCLNAINDFDPGRFEETLLRASMDLSQPTLIKSLIIPILLTIGDQWKQGSLRVMHEHLATAVLLPFLHNLRISYRPAMNAPSIMLATPSGQVHEIGALIIGLVAASEGWKVIYLGPNLPADEIAAATNNKNSRYILLSIVYPANDPYLIKELEKLHTLISRDVKIIIGGRVSDSYSEAIRNIGGLIIDDLDEFRKFLEIQNN